MHRFTLLLEQEFQLGLGVGCSVVLSHCCLSQADQQTLSDSEVQRVTETGREGECLFHQIIPGIQTSLRQEIK